MTGKEALDIIKNAPTIYVGCISDINTRFSFEIKAIEKDLEILEKLKEIIKGIKL